MLSWGNDAPQAVQSDCPTKRFIPKQDVNDPAYQQKLKDFNKARSTILDLFKDTSGSAVQKWLQTFDRNLDMCVSYDEFCDGLVKLEYHGDSAALFRKLDKDGSGEIMLEEIDLPGSKLWMKFRMWCAAKFDDPKHMMYQLSNKKDHHVAGKADFMEALPKLEWEGGHEEKIWQCLVRSDSDSADKLCLDYLRWFAKDKSKQHRKELAKREASDRTSKMIQERQEISKSLDSFKTFLKRKYSTCLRAWRAGIDLDGSMSIQKHELFLAVKDMSWPGNMRFLWKALDKDDSGITSLAELDLKVAERLAKFKDFTATKFGSAVEAFRAFDIQRKGKLKEQEFIEACRKEGFMQMNAALFHGLDWQKNKYVMEKDLAFLDTWRAPRYLICEPNEQAAQDFKKALLKVYKTYVRAWRSGLDRDNSNSVGYEEFEAAAKKIRFTGDIPGAWRSLDDDVSGFISLHEIDVEASRVISEFKCWADSEFGGVRRVFKIFSNSALHGTFELTSREFRKACMSYAYQGDSKGLFDALDANRSGALTLNEIAFIDTWELSPAQLAEINQQRPPEEPAPKPVKKEVKMTPRMLMLALPKPSQQPSSNSLVLEPTVSENSLSHNPQTAVSPYLPKLHTRLGLTEDFINGGRSFINGGRSSIKGNRNSKPMYVLSSNTSVDPSVSRIDTIKETIIQRPVVQQPREYLLGSDECDTFGLANLRQKTLDLRSRTISLLGKVEHSDQQFWSPVTPVVGGARIQPGQTTDGTNEDIEDLLQDVLSATVKPAKPYGNFRLPKF